MAIEGLCRCTSLDNAHGASEGCATVCGFDPVSLRLRVTQSCAPRPAGRALEGNQREVEIKLQLRLCQALLHVLNIQCQEAARCATCLFAHCCGKVFVDSELGTGSHGSYSEHLEVSPNARIFLQRLVSGCFIALALWYNQLRA